MKKNDSQSKLGDIIIKDYPWIGANSIFTRDVANYTTVGVCQPINQKKATN